MHTYTLTHALIQPRKGGGRPGEIQSLCGHFYTMKIYFLLPVKLYTKELK